MKNNMFDAILRYRVLVAFRGVPSPEHPEKAGFSIERVRVTSQKETKLPKSRRTSTHVRDQTSLDSRLGAFPAGVGSRASPSKNRRFPTRSGRSNLTHGSEDAILNSSALKGASGENAMSDLNNSINHGESVQSSEDQGAGLQQHLDPSDQGIGAERAAVEFEGTDVELVMKDAPRIETHLVDDDENAPNQATTANVEGIIEYATALPHKLSQPSCLSAMYY